MSYIKASLLATALTLLTSVSAHGTVSGIVSGGKYFPGYNPSFQYYNPEPEVAGWRIPLDIDNGFVPPSSYSNADIICHKSASNPLGTPIPVTAGSTVELQWTTWPESHHGPVLDYLAACTNNDCSTVDKTTLEFFKIGEAGLKIGSATPGTWASDDLIANNNTWVAKIPADIAPGQYVLRHEIIALHSAGQADGAQNYPQCIDIVVTGSGSATPAGVVGTKLYTAQDAGILVNIYQTLASYVIPGPKLYASGGTTQATTAVSSSAVASSSAAATPKASTVVASVASSSVNAPVATPSTVQGDVSAADPATDDETTTLQITRTTSVQASVATAAPALAATVTLTVTAKGPTITAAGPTVTVGGGNAATVTVTAAAKTVTVTAKATSKPVPSGASVEDLWGWLGTKLGGGRTRRHARQVEASTSN